MQQYRAAADVVMAIVTSQKCHFWGLVMEAGIPLRPKLEPPKHNRFFCYGYLRVAPRRLFLGDFKKGGLEVELPNSSQGETKAMRRILFTTGLLAMLVACKHDSKVQEPSQVQTGSTPSQTGEPVGQPTSPITATNVPNGPAQPGPDQQRPPSQQFATQPPAGSRTAPPASGQQNPPPQFTGQAPMDSQGVPPLAIPAGTRVRVRLEQTIDTKRNRAGEPFRGNIELPHRNEWPICCACRYGFCGPCYNGETLGPFQGPGTARA